MVWDVELDLIMSRLTWFLWKLYGTWRTVGGGSLRACCLVPGMFHADI